MQNNDSTSLEARRAGNSVTTTRGDSNGVTSPPIWYILSSFFQLEVSFGLLSLQVRLPVRDAFSGSANEWVRQTARPSFGRK